MSWIQTYTGEAFSPLEPGSETINIMDIAHSLSMLCRFNGHSMVFYSVAEHCVRMSELVPADLALHALLHDAAEAYIPRPIKPMLGGSTKIGSNIMTAIRKRFGLVTTPTIEKKIKAADLRMLATEKAHIIGESPYKWETIAKIKPFKISIKGWDPREAKKRFLKRFEELTRLGAL